MAEGAGARHWAAERLVVAEVLDVPLVEVLSGAAPMEVPATGCGALAPPPVPASEIAWVVGRVEELLVSVALEFGVGFTVAITVAKVAGPGGPPPSAVAAEVAAARWHWSWRSFSGAGWTRSSSAAKVGSLVPHRLERGCRAFTKRFVPSARIAEEAVAFNPDRFTVNVKGVSGGDIGARGSILLMVVSKIVKSRVFTNWKVAVPARTALGPLKFFKD
jgi:hypothetical protein